MALPHECQCLILVTDVRLGDTSTFRQAHDVPRHTLIQLAVEFNLRSCGSLVLVAAGAAPCTYINLVSSGKLFQKRKMVTYTDLAILRTRGRPRRR